MDAIVLLQKEKGPTLKIKLTYYISGQQELKQRRLKGKLVLYNFPKRGSREGSAHPFSLVTNDRMHGNGSKLYQQRLKPDSRKNLITKRTDTGTSFLKRWLIAHA